jgi:carbamoyltransferase
MGTMIIAGANAGMSRDGKVLKDGAACVLVDGTIQVAVAEERLSGVKHDSGFERSLQYCLESVGASIEDLDMLVVSNCADSPLRDGDGVGVAIDSSKVFAMPSHHLSHAEAAFYPSPFESALVAVIDNEGNVFDPPEATYETSSVERNSYFIGDERGLTPIAAGSDRLAPGELGAGEVYRHFTYFLGWHSYVFAGKTMGLAPYGDPRSLEGLRLFDLRDGEIHSLLERHGGGPVAAVLALARSQGVDIGKPRVPGDPVEESHCDLAALVQSELERAILYKVDCLSGVTGLRDLCISGGVALNCVANRAVLDGTPIKRLFVPSAPGDSGQCIGNALHGWFSIARRPRASLNKLSEFLGRSYGDADFDYAEAQWGDDVVVEECTSRDAARLLSDGHVLGLHWGRSELGPRALGARSMLADARLPRMRAYLNEVVKYREDFRPFAPAILEPYVADYFDLPQSSNYMELTALVHQIRRKEVPAIVHVDGSARVQTVSMSEPSALRDLLLAFFDTTGVPLLLNTSLNLNGQPIVETPTDSLTCLMNSNLDGLFMNGKLYRKRGQRATAKYWTWLNH